MQKFKVRVLIASTVTVEAESPDHAVERAEDVGVKAPTWFADVMTIDIDEIRAHEPAEEASA